MKATLNKPPARAAYPAPVCMTPSAPARPARRRWLGRLGAGMSWLALPAAGLLLAGCASGPRTVELSEAQLLERLSRRFPMRTRVLGVFPVEVGNPRLRLLPDSNRIVTRLDYVLDPVMGGTRRVGGQFQLSYALRYEASDQTVRLVDVRAEPIEAAAGEAAPGGLPAGAPRLDQIAALLAPSLLKDFVLHRFRPEDLQAAEGRGLRPGAFKVVPGALQLTLEPVPR